MNCQLPLYCGNLGMLCTDFPIPCIQRHTFGLQVMPGATEICRWRDNVADPLSWIAASLLADKVFIIHFFCHNSNTASIVLIFGKIFDKVLLRL